MCLTIIILLLLSILPLLLLIVVLFVHYLLSLTIKFLIIELSFHYLQICLVQTKKFDRHGGCFKTFVDNQDQLP